MFSSITAVRESKHIPGVCRPSLPERAVLDASANGG